jgi:tRNA(fMet)-specific endonuclease VapC
MLDSNVLIDIAREPEGIATKTFEAKALGEVSVSVIVSGEVLYGMRKRPDARSNPRMRFILSSLRIDGLEAKVGDIFGHIRLSVEKRGKGLSANDYWIAAHAISLNAVLVTNDRAIHEAGIEGLKLEDWRDQLAVHR